MAGMSAFGDGSQVSANRDEGGLLEDFFSQLGINQYSYIRGSACDLVLPCDDCHSDAWQCSAQAPETWTSAMVGTVPQGSRVCALVQDRWGCGSDSQKPAQAGSGPEFVHICGPVS
jgi:hypothetical protein